MIIKFIHKIIALFLTFVLLANNINNVVIVTDFMINQDFIAKTLCIQKEEQKGCNGKCQLKKQLTKSTSQDNNQPLQLEKRTELSQYIIISNRLKTTSDEVRLQSKNNQDFYAQNLKSLLFVFKIKQPPQRTT